MFENAAIEFNSIMYLKISFVHFCTIWTEVRVAPLKPRFPLVLYHKEYSHYINIIKGMCCNNESCFTHIY